MGGYILGGRKSVDGLLRPVTGRMLAGMSGDEALVRVDVLHARHLSRGELKDRNAGHVCLEIDWVLLSWDDGACGSARMVSAVIWRASPPPYKTEAPACLLPPPLLLLHQLFASESLSHTSSGQPKNTSATLESNGRTR